MNIDYKFIKSEYLRDDFNNNIIKYEIFNYIKENPNCRVLGVNNYLRDKYEDKINTREVKYFLKEYFKKDAFCLTQKEKDSLSKINYIYISAIQQLDGETYQNNGALSTFEIIEKKYMNVIENKEDRLICLNLVGLLKFNVIKSKDILFSLICDYVYEIDEFMEYYDKLFCYSDSITKYLDTEINKICVDEYASSIARVLGITTIGDLKDVNNYRMMLCVNIHDIKGFITQLQRVLEGNAIHVRKIIESTVDSIKPKAISVLFTKYGVDNDLNVLTLEATGKIFGVTRERIRQLESVTFKKIKLYSKQLEDAFELIKAAAKSDEFYLTYEDVLAVLEDKKLVNILCAFLMGEICSISFDNELMVFYDKDEISIDEIVNSNVEMIDAGFITMDKYKLLSDFEKRIVNLKYKYDKSRDVYILKGELRNEFIYKTVDDVFKEGYHIETSDYDILKKKIQEIYGESVVIPEDRVIYSAFPRRNYCLIDRGTYLNRKFCKELPEYLTEEIISFVASAGTVVLYGNIFNKFRVQLMELGIDNKYYLKGLLDEKLDKDLFKTSRESIAVGDHKATITNQLKLLLENSENGLTIDQINKLLPGMQPYQIQMRMLNNKDAVFLSMSHFIHEKYLNYSSDLLKEIKNFIDAIFEKMGEEILGINKIYAQFRVLGEELFSKMSFVKDSYTLYSVLNYYFRDDYGWSRPYISKNKECKLNKNVIYYAKLEKMEKFSLDDVKRIGARLAIGTPLSSLEFLDNSINMGFVQIGVKTMLKKDKFVEVVGIDNINKINAVIKLLVDKNGKIDTTYFNNYSLFPIINYRWNKYLLSGYVKAFLQEQYIVDNTTNFYDTTDYIIRKVGNKYGD